MGSTSINEFLFASLGTNGKDAPRAPQDTLADKEKSEKKVVEIELANIEASDYPEDSWDVLQTAWEIPQNVLTLDDSVEEAVLVKSLGNLGIAYDELKEKQEQWALNKVCMMDSLGEESN